MNRAAVHAIALVGAVLVVRPVAAQVFEFTAGTSSLIRAHGGGLQVHGGDYDARVGVGVQDGRDGARTVRAGLSLQRTLHGFQWNFGDQSLQLSLPTDPFGQSRGFTARGLGVTRRSPRGEWSAFGGATSAGFYTPFFQGAETRTAAGAFLFERQLGARARAFSRNVVSNGWTSIQALKWTPRRALELALAGGVGANQPFGSASLGLDSRRLEVDAAYTSMGDGFRRLPIEGFASPEKERESLYLRFRPWRSLHVSLQREHYLAAPRSSGGVSRSTLNGAAAGIGIGRFGTHGSLYLSSKPSGQARAYSLGADVAVSRAVEIGAACFVSGPRSRMLVGQLRETPTPRLSLTQVVNHASGRTHIAWGGQILLSRATVGVDYQTTFLALAPAGQPQFRQVVLLNVRFPLPGGLRLNATTHVDPAGQARYTAYAGGFAYGRPISGRSGAGPARQFSRHVVRGVVVDTAGRPIAGAALGIDSDLVFTDSRGLFEARVPRGGNYSVEVVLDQFMFPGVYEVVSAPPSVRAAREDDPVTARIVLRRLR